MCIIITFEIALFFCFKETNGAFRESNLFMNILSVLSNANFISRWKNYTNSVFLWKQRKVMFYYFNAIYYPIYVMF